MNFLSAYNSGGSEMSCHYCKRVFKSYRIFEIHLRAHQDVAKLQRYKQNDSDSYKISINSTSNLSLLCKTGNSFGSLGNNPLAYTGGHLRAHQEEIKMGRNQNFAGLSRNPIDGTISSPVLSMNSLPRTPTIGSPLSKGIYPENSNGDPTTQLTLSPNSSYVTNKMASSTSLSPYVRTLPSTLRKGYPNFMGSYDVPLGHSPKISSTGTPQSNAVGSQSFHQGGSLTDTQHPNQNHLEPYPTYLMCSPCPGYQQMNDFNQGIVSNMFPSAPLVPYDNYANLPNKRVKEQWGGRQGNEIPESPSKRPKINFIPPVFHEREMPGKKELLFFKYANMGKEESDASENCETKLDLSLHL